MNIASALTPIHNALGARTIHGMALRASPTEPSVRKVTRTATAAAASGRVDCGGAADRDDHDADPERIRDTDAVEQHEEQQRTGRVAGDVGVPVVGRVPRDVVDERTHHRSDRVDALRVVDVLAGSFEDARQSVGALRHRERHGPDPAAGECRREQDTPRRAFGDPGEHAPEDQADRDGGNGQDVEPRIPVGVQGWPVHPDVLVGPSRYCDRGRDQCQADARRRDHGAR